MVYLVCCMISHPNLLVPLNGNESHFFMHYTVLHINFCVLVVIVFGKRNSTVLTVNRI